MLIYSNNFYFLLLPGCRFIVRRGSRIYPAGVHCAGGGRGLHPAGVSGLRPAHEAGLQGGAPPGGPGGHGVRAAGRARPVPNQTEGQQAEIRPDQAGRGDKHFRRYTTLTY